MLIIGLLYWCRRRRRSGPASGVNSDRDQAVQIQGHPNIPGAEFTHFQYDPGVGGTMSAGTTSAPHSPTFSGNSSMRQYRDSQALLGGYTPEGGGVFTATSGSQYEPASSEPDSAHPSSSRARSSSPRGTGFEPRASLVEEYHRKESDALRQRRALVLASAPEVEDVVVQHMDGGHVPEVPFRPRAREIPPSYDSIPPK
ncbi:hypothetical protein BC826DRAFT_1178688 [Russula brevipes]|nr:hypothetical protein BC826DRAFT_1178688 [Russula brevipes]